MAAHLSATRGDELLFLGIPIARGRVERVIQKFERLNGGATFDKFDFEDDRSSVTAESCGGSVRSESNASEYLRSLQKFNKSNSKYYSRKKSKRRARSSRRVGLDREKHDDEESFRDYSYSNSVSTRVSSSSSSRSGKYGPKQARKQRDSVSASSHSSKGTKSSRWSSNSVSSYRSQRSKSSRSSSSNSSYSSRSSRKKYRNRTVSRKEMRRRLEDRFSIVELEGFMSGMEPTSISLLEACRAGDEGKVVALQGAGVDINSSLEEDGSTPLIVAVKHRHEDVVTTLYGLGAKLENVDHSGNTALCCAARVADAKMFKALLQIGADVTAENNDGDSVLVLVARNLVGAKGDRYQEVMNMCQTLVEMEKATLKHVPTAEDIGDEAVACVVEEWVAAKCNMKDLHIPPLKVFRKGTRSLRRYFNKAHQEYDWYEVAKVATLLFFIAYDFVSAGLTFNSWSFVFYVILYCAAYFL